MSASTSPTTTATGPVTPFGKAASAQNATRHGLASHDAARRTTPPDLLHQQAEAWRNRFPNLHDDPLAESAFLDLAIAEIRIQRCRQAELPLIDLQQRRDRVYFESDPALAAAERLESLHQRPARVVAHLKQSSAGCDLLAEQWTILQRVLDHHPAHASWTPAQLDRALDLLGLNPHTDARTFGTAALALRQAHQQLLQNPADPAPRATLSEFLTRQIDALTHLASRLRAEVDPARLALIDQGLSFTLGPELRLLRRYESDARRIHRQALAHLQTLSPQSQAEPKPEPRPQAKPKPQPKPRATPPTPLSPTSFGLPYSVAPLADADPDLDDEPPLTEAEMAEIDHLLFSGQYP